MVKVVPSTVHPGRLLVLGLKDRGNLPLRYLAPLQWESWEDDLPLLQAELPADTTYPLTKPRPYRPLHSPQFGQTTLRNYQIQFVECDRPNLLLCDDPGMGKTEETIGWVLHRMPTPIQRTEILVSAGTLILQWADRIHKMAPQMTVHVARAEPEARARRPWLAVPVKRVLAEDFSFYIDTYDGLGKSHPKHLPAQCGVLDEGHWVKNRHTLRSVRLFDHFSRAKYRIVVTATPVLNYVRELQNQLRWLDPGRFADYDDFVVRYCGAKWVEVKTHKGKRVAAMWDDTGSHNQEELLLRLQDMRFARITQDYLPDLPPVIRSVVPVHLTNRKEYEHAQKHFMDWYRSRGSIDPETAALAKATMLRHIGSLGKVASALEVLTPEPTVIYTAFRDTADLLALNLGDQAFLVDGDVPKRDRQSLIDRYAARERPYLIFTIRTGGEGVDGIQHGASRVMFLDVDWTPMRLKQAEDRVHRDGQKLPTVVQYLIAEGSVEESVYELLLEKVEHLKDFLGTDMRTLFKEALA